MSVRSANFRFLPLKRLLQGHNFDPHAIDKKDYAVLLPKIKGIPREIVDQLELAGIYDNMDLEKAGKDILDYLGIEESELRSYFDLIDEYISENYDLPTISLPLPENYAFVAAFSDDTSNAIALLWNKFLFTWSCPANEQWILLKHQLEDILQKQDHPELISSLLSMDDTPNWLSNISDYSLYISGINPLNGLDDYATNFGYPDKRRLFGSLEKAERLVLQLEFVCNIARSNSFN